MRLAIHTSRHNNAFVNEITDEKNVNDNDCSFNVSFSISSLKNVRQA